MDKQTGFDFGESPKLRRAEPSHKVKVPRESTSLCAYCGARMPSALLDTTPVTSDLKAWVAAEPYHGKDCRWLATRGLRVTDA